VNGFATDTRPTPVGQTSIKSAPISQSILILAGKSVSGMTDFVEVNSRNLGGSHVCWGSYDGFNFAGWRGGCG